MQQTQVWMSWRHNMEVNNKFKLRRRFGRRMVDYVTSLKQGFIFLEVDKPDTIVWSKNKKSGNYTVKLGYLAIAKEQVEGVSKWWWKSTWKWKAPEKMKIIF
jgi:hypothetical protein